jgi:hypothetical protein
MGDLDVDKLVLKKRMWGCGLYSSGSGRLFWTGNYLWIPWKAGNFFTSWVTISYSKDAERMYGGMEINLHTFLITKLDTRGL